MRRRVAILAVLLVPAALLAGCGGGGGGTSSKADYIKANESLFKSLPAFPKEHVASEGTSTYAGTSNSVGYQTRFNLTLPKKATTDTLQSFFAGHLQPDWKLVAQLDGPVLNFRKGNAFVSVNLAGAHGHRAQVTVDQAFYSHTG